MLSLYTRYLKAVEEAITQEPKDWIFKNDERYREVLEHTPVEFAQAMFHWSLRALPGLDPAHVRALCELNDSVGAPIQQPIAGLGTYATSNMRYLCHAIKVWQHIESLDADNPYGEVGHGEYDIIEIGGGYGGLALYIQGIERFFSSRVLSYTILDLPSVAALQRHVADRYGPTWYACDGADTQELLELFQEDTRWPYCVSAYAFSEFDQATRDWYAERVLKYCRHGLMIWNFPEALKDEDGVEFGGPPYQFVEWPITRVPDEPRLYESHEMVTW